MTPGLEILANVILVVFMLITYHLMVTIKRNMFTSFKLISTILFGLITTFYLTFNVYNINHHFKEKTDLLQLCMDNKIKLDYKYSDVIEYMRKRNENN